jgi:type II secretory pathway pseudopilin PulG
MVLLQIAITFGSIVLVSTMLSPPVLWRPTATPITLNHQDYYILIHLNSPCELLSNNVVHPDMLEITVLKCKDLYETLFLKELEIMCPSQQYQPFNIKTHDQVNFGVLQREKRELFTLIVCLVIVVTVALAAAGTVTGSIALQNTHQLQSAFEEQEQQLQEVAKQLDLANKAIEVLQHNVKILRNATQTIEDDLTNVKKFQPSTTWAISYLTSRLMDGNFILKETTRKWLEHKLHAPFFDYLNFTLPCGTSCPLQFAVAKKCSLTHDKSRLYLDFSVPRVDSDLQLLEADPFDLMVQRDNETCSIVYSGPKNVIMSKTKDCVYSVNVRHSDIILSPASSCKDSQSLPDNSKFFKLGTCKPTHPSDKDDYIQVKFMNNSVF